MSFVKRAERAHTRGDETRAIMVLIEGLKREPGRQDAIELLVLWFSVESPTRGLEADLVKMLGVQPEKDDIFSAILDNLRANGRDDIAEALIGPASRAGLTYIPMKPKEDEPLKDQPAEDTHLDVSQFDVSQPDQTVDGFAHVELEEPEKVEHVEAPVEQAIPEPEQEPAPKPPEPAREKASKKREIRWTKRHSFGAIFLMLVTLGVSWYWVEGRRVAEIHSLDTLIGTLDPLDLNEALGQAGTAARNHPGSKEIEERYQFLLALQGSESQYELQDGAGEWGVAHAFLKALEAKDLESAIRLSKELELKYPDSLASLWTAAMLAEFRGDEGAQDLAFDELNRLYPEFLDGWLGKLRLAVRRGDAQGVELARERIGQLVPDHPYLRLNYENQRLQTVLMGAELDDTGGLVLREGAQGSMWEFDSPPVKTSAARFFSAFGHYQRALWAAEGGERARAQEEVALALEIETELGPARVLQGALRLRGFDAEGIQDLRLLRFVGSAHGELLDLGFGFGAIASVGIGNPSLAAGLLKGQDGPWSKLAASHLDHELRGEALQSDANFFQATEDFRTAFQVSDTEAERLLGARTGLLPDLLLEGPRLWMRAYLKDPTVSEDLKHRMSSLGKESVFLRVWLIDSLLWLGDRGAFDHLESIEEGHGFHFHWVSAIVSRAKGEYRDADVHFSNAGVENSASLANYAMRLERLGAWDESRKMYHKSLLSDRANMEAIQGLGRTYLKLGGETAARDMERIALGYNGGDYVAQRAESLKWFGIILGVRSGDETALSKIEAAIEAVGPRADLLVEVGHYWFARSDLNQARVSFSQALQADSTNADAHYGLGRVAWETRDFQIAEDHLRKYLELQPRGEHRKWVEERLSRLK